MSKLFKVGTHQGNKRVWFQGGHLTKASFMVGVPYTVTYSDDHIDLVLAAEGEKGTRKVSKKPSKSGPVPVIDLNSKAVSQFFDDSDQCLVTFGAGIIQIARGVTNDSLTYQQQVGRALRDKKSVIMTLPIGAGKAGVK